MRLLLLLTLLFQLSFSEELLFFQEEQSQWKITGGTVELLDESMKLTGSASVDMKRPDFFPPQSGKVSFFLRHHLHDPSPMALVEGSKKRCHCALKLRFGTLEFEIGENHVKVQRLTQKLTLEKILQERQFELEKCGDEFLVTITFDKDSLALFIDKEQELSLKGSELNLYDITLSTYMGSFTVSSFSIESSQPAEMIVNKKEKRISIPALYMPKKFNNPLMLKNHHLVTWQGGKAAPAALFITPIPDKVVHRGLEEIGATPGNNLTTDSWNKRHSKKSKDPDIVATGTALEISIRKEGKTYKVENILHDDHKHAYNFVFSGNLEFIPVWHSGCVICLQSCPGSKVANASYTMRDLAKKNSTFTLMDTDLQPGEALWIDFTIKR